MAIRLTDTIQTSEGSTTTLYFHITEFYRSKDGTNATFPVKFYTNEDKATPCEIFEGDLKKVFNFDISATIGTDAIEKAAYDAIGAALLAAGLNPESDETASWVAYS